MKKLFFLPLFALLFLAVSCPQQNPTPKPTPPEVLPPATQMGANTFGCLINGNVWIAGGGGVPAIVPTYNKERFTLGAESKVFDTKNQPVLNQSFILSIFPVQAIGKYYISNANDGAGFTDWLMMQNYVFKNNDSLQNWIQISKIDSTNLIISGTFNLYFTASGQDTLRITEGRFDAKYSN